jgi:hypothetical protein
MVTFEDTVEKELCEVRRGPVLIAVDLPFVVVKSEG